MHCTTRPFLTLILLIFSIASAQATDSATNPASDLATYPTPLPAYSQGYDPARDPFADGRAAIQLATGSGRRILIEVGGDWCSWCHLLDRFISSDPLLQSTLHQHYVVLKINVSEENDNAAFMQGLPRPLGYPHMYVARGNGSLIHSQDTAEFLLNKQYNQGRFLAFLHRWSPTGNTPP